MKDLTPDQETYVESAMATVVGMLAVFHQKDLPQTEVEKDSYYHLLEEMSKILIDTGIEMFGTKSFSERLTMALRGLLNDDTIEPPTFEGGGMWTEHGWTEVEE